MAYLRYPIRPIQHAISTDNPSLFTQPGFSPWVSNGRIEQGSFMKRWGYTTDRSIGAPVYSVLIFQQTDGTRFTIYATGNDIIKKETGTNKTWSYITDTLTTPVVTGMEGTKTVVTFSGGGLTAGAVAAGDKFIVTADHTADEEPDTNWATVLTKDSDTQLTLTAAYTGASTTGACKIRRVYGIPAYERWSYAVINNTLCMTNGSNDVLYWTGSGYVVSLDSANAKEARYCIEYANRLFLADVWSGGIRKPLTLKWSKENDATNWTDTTAGEADILETEDFITGLGKVGGDLVVYKRESIFTYSRTGEATQPISKTSEKRGIGCVAPYSIVDFLGTNAFLGRDDFYVINAGAIQPIGTKIRCKFFELVADTEVSNTWGGSNPNLNEIFWVTNTSEGQVAWVWNYKNDEWYVYMYEDNMKSFGRGAI